MMELEERLHELYDHLGEGMGFMPTHKGALYVALGLVSSFPIRSIVRITK